MLLTSSRSRKCACRKKYGLIFIDGHYDFYNGKTSPTGEASDMELAIITGHAPPFLDKSLRSADIMLYGCRDLEEMTKEHVTLPSDVIATDPDAMRAIGMEQCADTTYYFQKPYWVHLALDVLATKDMPAVDYPQSGGLSIDELSDFMRPMVQSENFIGMDVTIYNPTLDPERTYAKRIVQLLKNILD